MTDPYRDRYLLVCTPAGAEAGRQLFALVGECSGDADPEASENLRSPLVPAGSPPEAAPTHYREDVLVRGGQRQVLAAVEDAGGLPADGSLVYVRLELGWVVRAVSPHPALEPLVGTPADWPEVLDALGLRVPPAPSGPGG